ncbi:hypothetical protein BV898_12788 [Hypsibius exemplaris]|uniref:Chromo domain-containing protein n=1 Tax=Hypsibius exemplaris TaxID=2072580 RepID=A0A1W0WCQ9_HYPEX|nr:hypothetical protein BV898_12788 [Hypsibius exemplaris]
MSDSSSEGEPVDNNSYVAEAVRDMRTKPNGKRKFLIKWSGWDERDNTWEPETGVQHLDIYTEYLKSLKSRRDSSDGRSEKEQRKEKERLAREKRVAEEQKERDRQAERHRLKKQARRERKAKEAEEAHQSHKKPDGPSSNKSSDGALSIKSSDGPSSIKRSDGAPSNKSSDGAPSSKSSDGAPSIKSSDGPSSIKSGDGPPFIKSSDGAPSIKSSDGSEEAKPKKKNTGKEIFFGSAVDPPRQAKKEDCSGDSLKVRRIEADVKPKVEKVITVVDLTGRAKSSPGKKVAISSVLVGKKLKLKPYDESAVTKILAAGKEASKSVTEREKAKEAYACTQEKSPQSFSDASPSAASAGSPASIGLDSPEIGEKAAFSPEIGEKSASSPPVAPSPPPTVSSRAGSEEIPEKHFSLRLKLHITAEPKPSTSRKSSSGSSPDVRSPNTPKSRDDRSGSEEIPYAKPNGRLQRAPSPSSSDSDSDSSSSDVAPRQKAAPLDSGSDGGGSEEEAQYSVKRVLKMRGVTPNREFFVEWEGYDSDDDTWEPESGVGHLDVVKEFLLSREQDSGTDRKRRHASPSSLKSERRDSKAEKAKVSEDLNFYNRSRKDQYSSKTSSQASSYDTDSSTGKKKLGSFKIPLKAKVKSERNAATATSLFDNIKLPDVVRKAPKVLTPEEQALEDAIVAKIRAGAVAHPTVDVARREGIIPRKPTPIMDIPDDWSVTEEDIRYVLPGEDPKLFQLIMNSANPPATVRKSPTPFSNMLPLDGFFKPSPCNPDRFEDLRRRVQYMKMSESQRVLQPEPERVVPRDHVLEVACQASSLANDKRGMRFNEVISSCSEHVRTRILPQYRSRNPGATSACELDPGGATRGREIALFLVNKFKNVPVMLHLGRDVLTYEREKKNQRNKIGNQKAVKQVQRPPRRPREEQNH